MRLSTNGQTILAAALVLERDRGLKPWTAADLMDLLDRLHRSSPEGYEPRKPSDATVYRLLSGLQSNPSLLTSAADPADVRAPGRPRRVYQLTAGGREAAERADAFLVSTGVNLTAIA